jgi:hypothetical protein
MSGARVQLSAHPRAARHIATAKGWGGLIGFGGVFLLSMRAHMSVFESGVHALGGGIALYLLAWAGAVAIWREVALAEVERARRMTAELNRAAAEEAEARAKAKAQAEAAGRAAPVGQ